MKSILLIGVGGTGSAAVDILYQKIKEFGNQTDNHISAVVFDTDVGSVTTIRSAEAVSMADPASVGTICDRIGKEFLREWFPCDKTAVRSQEMVRGASQWRKKSFLAFLNLMNKQEARTAFHRALDSVAIAEPGAACEIYVIASIAGGTGSGSFIPISLYARRYIRDLGKEPIVSAMIACPDIYAESQTPENRIKIYANAYAILRELNAINLVTNNDYNRVCLDNYLEKKAPVRFRIGHPDEPNVGVLFDASDERFWTPDAAPFSQVFILDKIPGVHSVHAHEIVLANSLYTILCTDIGAAMDSEASNHVVLHSQNNGGNAIYAGISTAQLCFPSDSVLNYLAHKKAIAACEGEWLTLHNATEERVHEEELRAKEMRRQFFMKDGDYAKFFLAALKAEEGNATSSVASLVERCTYRTDGDGNKYSLLEEYFESMMEELAARIEPYDKQKDEIEALSLVEKPGLFGAAEAKTKVINMADEINHELRTYFGICVRSVCDSATGLAEAMLTFDERKDKRANRKLSIVENVLMRDGKYIHPVAAVAQLCRFKLLLHDFLDANRAGLWKELKTGEAGAVPSSLLVMREVPSIDDRSVNERKSAYCKMNDGRLSGILSQREEYMRQRTCPHSDSVYLRADGVSALQRIRSVAEKQIQTKVLEEIDKRLNDLIAQYRAFFTRFASAKTDFEEAVKTARRRDAGRADSVLNIYSTESDKDAILKQVLGDSGADSLEDVLEADHIAGESIFDTAYISAAMERNNEGRPSLGNVYKNLFENMVASYRKTIAKSTAYQPIGSCNVIDAIIRSAGKQAEANEIKAAVRSMFAAAMEIAKPALQVDMTEKGSDVIKPSDITVVMMSYETAKSIKSRADLFGIKVTDGVSEEKIVKSCAEEFVHIYSGNYQARIALVRGIPDQILYITGEKMDITPLRIPKFDEMSANPLYFKNYQKALANLRHFDTDMWNPHLGNDLYKRGFLPYMNADMEKICDEKLVKAMLYGIVKKKIILKKGKSASYTAFRYLNEIGNESIILTAAGDHVNMKNVAELFTWLRNEDTLIEKWSEAFDGEIATAKSNLSNIVSESDVGRVSGEITRSSFVKTLRAGLFAGNMTKDAKGIGIIEFAYAVKASEEAARDCDDADRLLKITSDLFKDICRYKTSNPEHYVVIYKAQLDALYEAYASSYAVQKERSSKEPYFNRVVEWVNSIGAYCDVHSSRGINPDGSINYVPYESTTDIQKLLKYVPHENDESANDEMLDSDIYDGEGADDAE